MVLLLNGKAAKRRRKTDAKDITKMKTRQMTPENQAFSWRSTWKASSFENVAAAAVRMGAGGLDG